MPEVLTAVSGLIGLGNKLMDKYPNYKQAIELDWNNCVKRFESYKNLPREQRVSTYLYKLKQEVENHLISAKDYL